MIVKLTSGKRMIVSSEDADIAQRWSWATDKGYAYINVRIGGHGTPQRKIRVHRLIMERVIGRPLTPQEQVDHINHNTLDNRRCNLRVATHGQNLANRHYSNKSGYRGVIDPVMKYTASIKVDHTKIHIGSFDTAEEAAWMYDQYANQLHGEFATLNFDYV